MEVIKKEIVDEIPLRRGRGIEGSGIISKIADKHGEMAVGDGVVIRSDEWPLMSVVNSAFVNKKLKQRGVDGHFTCRTIQKGREFIFIKTK